LKVLTTAEPYLKEDTWSYYKIHHYNDIAFCYQQFKEYDKSTENFEKVIPCITEKQDSLWYGLTKGNIGTNYLKQGKLEKATAFIKIDLEYSLKYNDICSAVADLVLLGEIATKQKKYTVALKYFNEAEQKVVSCGSKSSLSRIYMHTSNTYRDMGNTNMAYQYLLKHNQLSDSLKTYVSNQKAMETTISFEKQKTELQAQLATIEGQRSKWQRNFAFLILFLSGIVGYFWYCRVQQKKAAALEEQTRKLDIARKEIQEIKDNVAQKNELIEKFKTELDQRTTDDIFDEAGWEELRQSTILTDKDWFKFMSNFEKLYPNFIQKLQQKTPNLSQGDLRLLLLTQLQINTRDMAAVLGVSMDAIRKSRHRLRKKLDLPEENFAHFLENI
jgi:tetratricopeptide (TPR) repeat protein